MKTHPWIAAGSLALPALGLTWLLFWPVPIDPVAWMPPPDPGFTGPYAENTRLADIKRLAENLGPGPEDLAFDGDGQAYTGLHNGRIMRIDLESGSFAEFVRTGGRPLGMKFDGNGNLIVADAFKGLLSITAEGSISTLATAARGIPFGITDDLDIADDGTIYFTDGSSKFALEDSLLDLTEHGGHGRLLSYVPEPDGGTGKVQVLMDGLNFPNGVAVSPDQDYLLLAETGAYRVWRFWLRGSQTGTPEVLIDNLPGYPDNINTGSGVYWLALAAPRIDYMDRIADFPILTRLVVRVLGHPPVAGRHSTILGLNDRGDVIHNLQDPAGTYFRVTSVGEYEGALYLGSVVENAIGRISLP